MDSRSVLSHLKQICTDIDEGRSPRRGGWKRIVAPFAVPAAMAFSLSTGGCLEPDSTPVPLYSAPVEICDDGVDNTGNGLVDCDDPECADVCAVALYMAPLEEICDDGVDNTGNGLVDCDDPECAESEWCGTATPEYAAAFEICDDEIDNSGNGLVDCDDPACAEDEACLAVALYMAPLEEICDDGVDNNDNGLVDCDDPACAEDPLCMGVRYAAPM